VQVSIIQQHVVVFCIKRTELLVSFTTHYVSLCASLSLHCQSIDPSFKIPFRIVGMTPTMRKLPALLSPSSSSCFTCWSWTLWYAIVSLLYVALNLDSSGVVMIVCAMDTDDDGFFQEAATYEQEGSKFDHDSSSSCGSSQSHRCRVSPPHWLQENYPSPKENFKVCRCGENSKRLCDPDSILEDSEIAALEEEVLRPTFYLKDKFCSNNSNPFTKEKNTDQTAMKESESKPTQQQHDDAEVDVKSSSSSKDLSTLSNAIDEEKHEVFELQMAVALVKKVKRHLLTKILLY